MGQYQQQRGPAILWSSGRGNPSIQVQDWGKGPVIQIATGWKDKKTGQFVNKSVSLFPNQFRAIMETLGKECEEWCKKNIDNYFGDAPDGVQPQPRKMFEDDDLPF